MALVAARIVTPQSRRRVPADMLLVHERRRRMSQTQSEVVAFAHAADPEEIFSPDEDQLIEDEPLAATPLLASGDVVLRRPISQVSLMQVGWSGPVDHDALQSAIACQPVAASGADSYPELFAGQPLAPSNGDAALETTMHRADLAVLVQLARTGARSAAASVLLAAQLPDRLSGLEPATRAAVSAVLAGYRHASLSCAWCERLGQDTSVQAHRERDETAVAVLSTLRALLGER